MKLCLLNHSYRYELEKLIRIFLPFEKIEFSDTLVISDSSAVTEICETDRALKAVATLYLGGKAYDKTEVIDTEAEDIKKECELKLATALYHCFLEATGYTPDWGILTGVRPAKLFSRLSKANGQKWAEEYFSNTLKVSPHKISLCKEAVSGEEKIVSLSKRDSFSLYISIPFCPTRCSYCSFVSHSVEQAKKLVPQYIEKLCLELQITAKIARRNNLKLETVYIGGGTPTAVSADELRLVLEAVRNNFDLSNIKEYTVEAGRPDTFCEEKLKCIREMGVTRISINPQTMNNSVLEEIGRKHTSGDTVKAFKMARELGFCNINMDLIAGLPTDTFESFKVTLDEVLALDPESVTVHSLAMKRSSGMNVSGKLPERGSGQTVSQMVEYAREKLSQNGILPYYMYRQSKTVGNMENVGYAKNGYECLYNVYIMDETHSILACGASAVTKLREPEGDYIERIFNFKYPYEYIDRFEELISRKDAIDEFYRNFSL